jgi:hypothetical protein
MAACQMAKLAFHNHSIASKFQIDALEEDRKELTTRAQISRTLAEKREKCSTPVDFYVGSSVPFRQLYLTICAHVSTCDLRADVTNSKICLCVSPNTCLSKSPLDLFFYFG